MYSKSSLAYGKFKLCFEENLNRFLKDIMMISKRTASLILAIIFSSLSIYAQNENLEAKTPDKKIPTVMMTRRGVAIPQNEISLSYGGGTQGEVFYYTADIIRLMLTGWMDGSQISGINSSGAFSLEYQRFVHPYISVGAALSYENIHYFRQSENGQNFSNHANILYAVPMAKFQWFHKRNVGMYSKVGLGVMMLNDQGSSSQWSWATQITYAGIDFGSTLFRGFVEMGAGCQGMLAAGVKFRF